MHIFVQFMEYPVLHFELAHSGSRPFIYHIVHVHIHNAVIQYNSCKKKGDVKNTYIFPLKASTLNALQRGQRGKKKHFTFGILNPPILYQAIGHQQKQTN